MANFRKYYCFVQDLARGVHNLNAHVIKLALTNVSPDPVAHAQLADISEIPAGNGYPAGGLTPSTPSATQSGGVLTFQTDGDVAFAASGGDVGPFQFAVLYNATASGGPLIGYYDRGVSTVLKNTDVFEMPLNNASGILTVT